MPSPVRRLFDYLPPHDHATPPSPGMRVRVPFGRRRAVGMIIAIGQDSEYPAAKLKRVIEIIDKAPLVDDLHLSFLRWSSDYYQHPAGEVIINSLPAILRQGRADTLAGERFWCVTSEGARISQEQLERSPRQQALLGCLQDAPDGLSDAMLKRQETFSLPALRALADKGLVRAETRVTPPCVANNEMPDAITPSKDQLEAIQAIRQSLDSYNCFLLNGVTGSGKTEVYIQLVRRVIETGKQALVLLPEIALTPQFVQRLQRGIGTRIAVYHSGLTDRERCQTWIEARNGVTPVVLGTRSAIWIPLHAPGLFIVDEEHDLSYKQQESFRYSARDLALVRGRNSHCPVILGSATPSLESIYNLSQKDYRQILLPHRVANARMPEIRILDMKTSALDGALSETLHQHIRTTLARGQQVLVFQNRRGYAPAFMCHQCGWLAECQRCNKLMTLHKEKQLLWCHHCDRQIRLPTACPECAGQELLEIGHGTERIEETLKAAYPKARIVRIDRDTTRRKGSMHSMYEQILSGEADILVGTQMLAKGHHFPAVTLAAIVDVDSSLYSTDFRATERLGQLITQVSGRAGRGQDPGMVLIQTHFPDHPLLRTLLEKGYMMFSTELLEERRLAGLPPCAFMAMLRAEAADIDHVEDFLNAARGLINGGRQAPQVAGPVLAPMRRRAGRHRMQLILQSDSRQALNRFLRNWLDQVETLKQARRVRWSIDVDPQDMM